MTPKEKADSIFQQMYKILWHTNSDPIHCKECALIVVDEIINSIVIIDLTAAENQFTYWEEVKQEIEKI
jgi:hypothetical protein